MDGWTDGWTDKLLNEWMGESVFHLPLDLL